MKKCPCGAPSDHSYCPECRKVYQQEYRDRKSTVRELSRLRALSYEEKLRQFSLLCEVLCEESGYQGAREKYNLPRVAECLPEVLAGFPRVDSKKNSP